MNRKPGIDAPQFTDVYKKFAEEIVTLTRKRGRHKRRIGEAPGSRLTIALAALPDIRNGSLFERQVNRRLEQKKAVALDKPPLLH